MSGPKPLTEEIPDDLFVGDPRHVEVHNQVHAVLAELQEQYEALRQALADYLAHPPAKPSVTKRGRKS